MTSVRASINSTSIIQTIIININIIRNSITITTNGLIGSSIGEVLRQRWSVIQSPLVNTHAGPAIIGVTSQA